MRFFPTTLLAAALGASLLPRISADDPDVRRGLSSVLIEARSQTPNAIVVDKKTQTLFVVRRGSALEILGVYPCTTGKVPGDKKKEGDLKTPEGVYYFVDFIDGSTLPPLYGDGAYPMDYPNHFDRVEGDSGSGIWLHGVETEDRVSIPLDTRGCVAVSNRDLVDIGRNIRLHRTPIVIVDDLLADGGRDAEAVRAELLDLLDGWRESWQAKDIDSYLSHYDARFRSDSGDLDAWARHKRQVNSQYSEIRVGLRDEKDMIRAGDRAVVRFVQEYASDRHWDVGSKTLYLVRHGVTWRIVGEEWAPLPGEALAVIRQPAPVLIASRLPAGESSGRTPAREPVTVRGGGEEPKAERKEVPEPVANVAVKTEAAASAPETAPERLSPAPERLSPEPAEHLTSAPAAAGTAPGSARGRGLAIERFATRVSNGTIHVSFWLRNLAGESRPSTGFLTIVTRGQGGEVLGLMPDGAPHSSGVPDSPRAGEWFSARRFRVTEADIATGGRRVASVEVFAYDPSGTLVHREEFRL